MCVCVCVCVCVMHVRALQSGPNVWKHWGVSVLFSFLATQAVIDYGVIHQMRTTQHPQTLGLRKIHLLKHTHTHSYTLTNTHIYSQYSHKYTHLYTLTDRQTDRHTAIRPPDSCFPGAFYSEPKTQPFRQWLTQCSLTCRPRHFLLRWSWLPNAKPSKRCPFSKALRPQRNLVSNCSTGFRAPYF